MRNPVFAAFALLPLLSLAACGRSEQNESQPGMVANIMNQALPGTRDLPQDANSITPVEPAPDLPVAKGDAQRANAIPIGLQGRWAGLKKRCGDKAAALELRVTAASLVFHESVGTVQRISHGPDGQLHVDAAFTGEGDSWTRTLTLRPSADGRQLTIVNDGTAVVRKALRAASLNRFPPPPGPRYSGGMIGRLTLSDFRNHADALIVPDQAFILLTGDNGAGKTNILEAVSMLAPGRGLRGAALRDMARQDGPGGFGIAAEIDGVVLGTGAGADAPDRRQVRIGGVASSANALADHLSIVWLTPAMDRLFLDSPGGRRRFLDRLTLALHPGHAVHSARYEAAMRARNRLLTDLRSADPAWIGALEAQMADHGAALAAARADLVARLNAMLADQPDAPFARPHVAIAREEGADDSVLADRLARGRRRDAAAGRTLSGPHRHDLDVIHIAKAQAAALCSTGEQKALLLSILLAHAALVATDRGRPPVLLLDEVAAHLDPSRRAALFDRLRETGGQVWMTGTEDSLFNELSYATRLSVTAGHVFRSAA